MIVPNVPTDIRTTFRRFRLVLIFSSILIMLAALTTGNNGKPTRDKAFESVSMRVPSTTYFVSYGDISISMTALVNAVYDSDSCSRATSAFFWIFILNFLSVLKGPATYKWPGETFLHLTSRRLVNRWMANLLIAHIAYIPKNPASLSIHSSSV